MQTLVSPAFAAYIKRLSFSTSKRRIFKDMICFGTGVFLPWR
jgi:hypothetical protein